MISIILILCYNNFITFGLKYILNETYEVTSRISSLSHSIISSIMAILYIVNIIDYSILSYCVIYNILYLLTDIYLYLSNKICGHNKIEHIVHHIIFIITACISNINPYFYCRGIITEFSTIFLNLSWFAYKKKFNINNIVLYTKLLWISFLVFRIINLNVVFYEIYYSDYYMYSIFPVPFIILNTYWFYLITKKILNYNNS